MNNSIGKVIRILDNFTIIVSAGCANLSVGDTVHIFSVGEPILDLDGNILDYYYFIKDKLEVIQVEDNYSICRKNEFTVKTVFALSPMLEQGVKERVPINVDKKDIHPFQDIDPKIHIGDDVKLA